VNLKRSLLKLSLLILLLAVLAGCGAAQSSGTYVWIDVPEDGLSFPDLRPVTISGHTTGSGGVDRVELFVDGELWTSIDDPPMEDNLARFEAEWEPPAPGSYLIHAVAFSPAGDPSPQDQTRITFGLETATPPATLTPTVTMTPVISITPTITDTPTPVELPAANIEFWAEPETIDAGDCAELRWRVEGAQLVIFGGVTQPDEYSFPVCLCNSETYTLTVTQLDGSEVQRRVDVNVVGTCADTQPPPVPEQAVPGPGLTIGCKANQTLAWLPVSDESGIAEYRVKVQRHAGDNNWSSAPGSVFTGISGKQLSLPVECGWTYRWQVRAVDGEGNASAWSGWRQFTITLE